MVVIPKMAVTNLFLSLIWPYKMKGMSKQERILLAIKQVESVTKLCESLAQIFLKWDQFASIPSKTEIDLV